MRCSKPSRLIWNNQMWPPNHGLRSYIFRRETPGSRNKHSQDQMAKMVGLLLLSSLWCPLHAQTPSNSTSSNSTSSNSTSSNSTSSISPSSQSSGTTPDSSAGLLDDFITSVTNVTSPETRVLIMAPFAIHSTSLRVFTTGIPIQPVYIQAPAGLIVWLTIQCRGGAARVTLPQVVANFTMVQRDPTGEWILSTLPLNSTWPVTGLGIKFKQNVSVANDALGTLRYGKGADNDIAGKATMTITLNWNATSARENKVSVLAESKTIYIWAPTALTNLSTFQAALAGVCIVGIFGLCCIGCLNSVGVSYLRRFNVLMARETRDQEECEQNRVFNPLWMPCAPSKPGYYNIESTPNSVLLMQRRMEIKTLILRTPTTCSLMDRLTRAKYLKSSNYRWNELQLPCITAAPPRPPVDWSSDDEAREAALPRRASPKAKWSRTRQRGPSPTNLSPERPSLQSYNQIYSNYPEISGSGYNSEGQMYSGASSGNRLNHETITVGFALIHHRFEQDAANPEIVELEEEVGSGSVRFEGAEKSGEEVGEENGVEVVEEHVGEVGEGSDLDFDRASESFGSPVSDLYEDVLQS